MNVMNRKMFKKSRPARDALNQAGGIMDSSPELMQTVQNYPVPGVQNFAKGMSVFTDPTSPFYRPPTANRVSGPEDISDIRIPGGGTNRYIRSIYAEEGPNDGTKLAFLPDTLPMRQHRDYIPLEERGNSLGFFDQDEMFRNARKAGNAPPLVYDDQGISTGFDVEGRLILEQPRQMFVPDYGNPADLTQLSVSEQLEKDKAAIATFQAANPNEFVGLTKDQIEEKIAANPDLVREDGAGAFLPDTGRLNAIIQDNVSKGFSLEEAKANAENQVKAESETDYVAKIAEDEKAMATRERVMGDTNQGLDDQSYVSKILAEEEAQKTLDAKNEKAMATRERVMGDMDPGKGSKSVEEQMKNEIQNVVKNGTPEQKRSSLKELMAQFTDNAPKYEGMNKGLAIAKIGFAIAAGESPNALTNIAKGLSQGADAFIEDAAKRDAFKRQVDLSALQYGLGEESKYRAEDRTISSEDRAEKRIRDRALIGQTKFTAGDDGVTYKGRFYAPFTTVAVDKTDISNNKLPLGLMEPSVISSLQARKSAGLKLKNELIKNSTLDVKTAVKQQEAYASAVDNAIRAERGISAVEDVMIQVADGVSGISNAGKDFLARGKLILGIKGQENPSKIETVRASFRKLLQEVVPLTLGEAQSANSISDRDVNLLIRAYFGDNALEAGSFGFIQLEDKTILKNLQTVAEIMQNEQISAFSTMKRIETGMAPLLQAGTTGSALNLLQEDRDRLGRKLGNRTVGTQSGYSRDENGILVFNKG